MKTVNRFYLVGIAALALGFAGQARALSSGSSGEGSLPTAFLSATNAQTKDPDDMTKPLKAAPQEPRWYAENGPAVSSLSPQGIELTPAPRIPAWYAEE